MKTINYFSITMFSAVLGAMTLFSCEKENIQPLTEDEEVEIAESSSSLENATLEELESIEETLIENPEGGRVAAGCATVTRDQENKIITIDFGSGCVGPFGRERSGKIFITYGGVFGDNLANRVITFENYYVNNKNITGKIEHRDFNEVEGNITHTRKHTDLKITFPNGYSITSNGSTTVTWLEGQGDEDRFNNVYTISGSYTGITSRGVTITRTITEDLLVNTSCLAEGGFAIVGGKIEVKVTNRNRQRTRTIDYGDGTCDQTITVTINDKVFTITIS